jgi:hypothetical protein
MGYGFFGIFTLPHFDVAYQILKVIATLAEQYKSKEKDLEAFKREYNIRPVQ